jgi:hypothetical protein
MPRQTRHYVYAITGATVDDWAKGQDSKKRDQERTPDCRALVALLKRAPNLFVEELQHRVNLVAAAPWGVQLAAGFSRNRALNSYARMAKRYHAVLEGHDPSILQSVLRSRGTRPFYQVRVGAATRTEADALCVRIRRMGGPCIVLRNKGG